MLIRALYNDCAIVQLNYLQNKRGLIGGYLI
jgi:hypothetical protein